MINKYVYIIQYYKLIVAKGYRTRDEARALIDGVCVYSCIHVLPEAFLPKLIGKNIDFKRNQLGRIQIYDTNIQYKY